jgi:lipooligosaccharide transport system permease protein
MASAARTLPVRAVPPAILGAKRAGRVLERNLMVYRRAWVIIFSGFFEPIFYLFGIGLGIGELVGDVTGPGGQAVTYTEFVAPALLASSAMNGAIYESTMNIFFKLKFARVYDAILATPVGIGDVAVGEIAWCLIRGGLYATGFLTVMLVMGLMMSWWAVLALPAALLLAFAFSAVGMATTTFMRSWQDFDLVQLVILPLFLFSATFYPLETYPDALQWVVQLTPLYHGVDLIRSLTLGTVGLDELGHVAYLLGMGLVGLSIVSRRLERLLLT